MTTGDKRTYRAYGPWRGINEWPGECEPGQLEDAWNVDFAGDLIQTRGGRVSVANLSSVYPAVGLQFGREGVATTRVDATQVWADGDATTGVSMGQFGTNATDTLWIAFPFPVQRLELEVPSVNSNASVLSVAYYSAGSGYTNVSGLSDATSVGGASLNRSRQVTWTLPTDWVPSTLPDSGASGGASSTAAYAEELYGQLYWLRLRWSAALSNGVLLASVRATNNSTNGLLQGTNGLFMWSRADGTRVLVVGQDDQTRGIARLFELDRYQGVLKPFSIPGPYTKSGPDAFWSFAATPEGLVACNGYCLLYATPDKPRVMTPFRQLALADYSSRQTAPPTSAKMVGVFQDRLFVVPSSRPQSIRWSAPVGARYDLAPGAVAPMGGCHIWDPQDSADLVDPGGGGVTGMVSVASKLLLFTARSTWTWDGNELVMADPDVGCTSPRTIACAGNDVLFLGLAGIYVHTGGSNHLVSRTIEPTVRGLNRMALSGACATIYRKKTQYRLHVPNGQNNKNDLVLVYDYTRKTWTKYGVPPFVAAGNWRAYQVKAVLAARDDEWGEELLEVDYDGTLWTGDVGRYDGGQPILSIAVFDRVKFDEGQELWTARTARVLLQTRGTGATLTCALSRDGRSWKRLTAATTDQFAPGEKTAALSQLDPGATVAQQVYQTGGAGGGATIGTDPWRARRFVSQKASFGLSGRDFQMVLHTSASNYPGNTLTVKGWELDFVPRKGKR